MEKRKNSLSAESEISDIEIVEPPRKRQKLTSNDVERMIKTGTLELAAKPGKTASEVWSQFKLVKDLKSGELLKFAVCAKCQKAYAYDDGSTSNLSRHTCAASPNVSNQIQRFLKHSTIPQDALDEMKEAAIRYVATDMRPFEAISNPGLHSLLATAMKVAVRYA